MRQTNASLLICMLFVFSHCAEPGPERAPDNPMLLIQTWQGGAPSIIVRILSTKDNSYEDENQKCSTTLRKLGVPNNEPEPEVVVHIDASEREISYSIFRLINRRVVNQSKETRPRWSIPKLCQDALAAGLRTLLGWKAQGTAHDRTSASSELAENPVLDNSKPDEPSEILATWVGPPAKISIRLAGGASSRQKKVCESVMRRYGVIPQQDAPIISTIEVGDINRLKIVSRNLGLVVEGSRPEWTVDELCKDAIAQSLKAFRAEYGQIRNKNSPPSRL